jgi:ribulose kinase
LNTDSLAEAGQSSTGQLLDHMISTHPAQEKLMSLAKDEGINHFALLEKLLRSLEQQHGVGLSELTKSIHIYPDLHGMLCVLPSDS